MRVVMLTLGFCPARVWAECAEQVRRTRHLGIEHHFLYHYYPVREQENRRDLEAVCRQYGIRVMDPLENLGLHGGANWSFKNLGLTPDDILIGVDPDTYPVRAGWDAALVNVTNKTEYGWAALMNAHTPKELADGRAYEKKEINGVSIYEMSGPCVVSIAAYQMGWVLAAGGFHEPRGFYGHLETAMYPDLVKAGKRLAILADYSENDAVKVGQDFYYAKWKEDHAFNGYVGNFDAWLAEKHPEVLK